MLFLDPSDRETVELHGVKWEIGPVPFGKLEELELELLEHRKTQPPPGSPPDMFAAWFREISPVYCELIRWGLKGWNAPKLPLRTEDEQFAGVTFKVLTRPLVEVLCRIDSGIVISELGSAVLRANRLSADDVLGFN